MFTPCLHRVYTYVYTKLEDMFTQYLMTCQNNIRKHIYSMWEDMLTPSLNTCLHHVWNMFIHCMKHVYTIYKDLFATYEDMFSKKFKNIYAMFADLLIQCWQTCLHKIEDICYKLFKDIFVQICSKWCVLLKVDENIEMFCYNQNY